MTNKQATTLSRLPQWVNTLEYPFQQRFMSIDGNNISYVDEGEGDILLFVHGTPVWSYLYRHCIKELSKTYRCIALDHLGFGLSDKPAHGDYSPKAHGERLLKFINHLQLDSFTLITQDYGGPISLDATTQMPDKVSRLVISNSWMWLHPTLEKGGKLYNGTIGKWLYLNYGFSPKVMIPLAFGNRKKLTSELHQQYLTPLNTPQNRIATYPLVQAFTHDHAWYHSIQERFERLENIPTLMLWGMKDPFVRYREMMPLWKNVLKNMKLVELSEAGHFVEEEAPQQVVNEISMFLSM